MDTRKNLFSWGAAVGMAAMLGGCSGAPLDSMTSPSAAQVADGALSASSGGGGSSSSTVSCETRGTSRSKISVNGRNLKAGSYTAAVTSGGNTATSGPRAAVRGEVQFDFDSNPADITAGATGIGPTFIQGGSVTATIAGTAISITASCRVR